MFVVYLFSFPVSWRKQLNYLDFRSGTGADWISAPLIIETRPSPAHVLRYYAYSHPVLSANSVRAQRPLARLDK